MHALLKKPGCRGTLFGLACAALAWLANLWPPLRGLEEWLQDEALLLRGRRHTTARVVIVGLNEDYYRSLKTLKKSAINLSEDLAEVIQYVNSKGARAVGLDVIISEDLSNHPEIKQGAERLGDTICEAKNVVLASLCLNGHSVKPLLQWQRKALRDDDPYDFGFIDLTEDKDTIVRRQFLFDESGQETQFALALFARAELPQTGATPSWDPQTRSLNVGGEAIPLDEERKLRINFVGPPRSPEQAAQFPTIFMKDVLEASRTRAPLNGDFRGAIVVIGDLTRSQQDAHATPYANQFARTFYSGGSGMMAGSEIHANIIATLHDRAYLRSLPAWSNLALLAVGGALLGRAFARLNLALGLLLAVTFHFGWKLVAFAGLKYFNLRIEMAPMLVLGALAYTSTLVLRWWTLRRMLGVIKSEAVARLLANDPGQLDQRGEERVATVLFADIRNFTSFAEVHSAHEVVAFLNGYFDAIVPLIEQQGGTLNQYMGDGILVLFGVPVSQPDHALRAVRAAKAIAQRVRDLHAQWRQADFPGMRIGIGIHTGRVVAGMIGSRRRLDYTCIGDTVNTAARIEAKTKDFSATILISSDTYNDLPGQERRRLGCAEQPQLTTVKGRQQELRLHVVSDGQA